MPAPYPVLLRLEGRTCVIVGGGKVAARKCADLLEAGAYIIVISPLIDPRIEALVSHNKVTVERGVYTSGLLTALMPFLVFAATDDPTVNRHVATDAKMLGALVDTVDENSTDPMASDFSSMGVVRRGPITIGIGTGGASPTLAVHLRARVESSIGPEYGALAERLAGLRPLVRSQLPDESNRRQLWATIIDSPALDHLREGDDTLADQVILEILATFLNEKSHT